MQVGTIPETFVNNLPASLKMLGLSLNTLSGTIPTNFVLPDLYFMYLNDNMLTGKPHIRNGQLELCLTPSPLFMSVRQWQASWPESKQSLLFEVAVLPAYLKLL